MCFSTTNYFMWEQKEENNNIIRNASISDILTLLILLSADAKLPVVLRVPSLITVGVRNFSLLHFRRWLCLIHGQFIMSLQCLCNVMSLQCYVSANVSVSSIFKIGQFYFKYHFLSHRNSPSKRFSYASTATSLFLIFINQNINIKNCSPFSIYFYSSLYL